MTCRLNKAVQKINFLEGDFYEQDKTIMDSGEHRKDV